MIETNYAPRVVGLAARLSCAAAAGVAVGVLTLDLQGRLSGSWNVLANSGAVWTVVAVVVAAVLATTPSTAAVAGLLALVGEVGGYYWCAAPWHGVAVSTGEQVLWTAAAVVVGPFAGLAGYAVSHGTNTKRALALLSVCGVIGGEGAYSLRYIPQHHAAAVAEIVVACGVAALSLALSSAPWRYRLGALAAGVVVAVLVMLVYRAPVLG